MPNLLLCSLPQASAPGSVTVTLSRAPRPNAPAMGLSLCKFEYMAEPEEM